MSDDLGHARIRLAVVDRDPTFVAALEQRCRAQGWEVRALSPARHDPLGVRGAKVNTLLLDPAELVARGWERLGLLCESVPEIPLVICTGPSSVGERVRGLRLGAEDWVTKPCDLTELMVRIERVSRSRGRRTTVEEGVDLVAGEIELRPSAHLARIGGRIVDLSPREFELLRLFMTEAALPLERETIYRRVWGYAMPWGERSVDVYVLKLRRKLRTLSPGWTYLHTHHRLGYRFEAEASVQGRWPDDRAPATLATGRLVG
ncbi:MAG TPA: response regulator transcription factor [Solirubrobacterales bacterium]|nr:response regulator transcription factor [Solirubrobacterales bacterium]